MLTYRMIAYVQCLIMACSPSDKTVPPGMYKRLSRIEDYLIRRFNRME